MKSIRHHKIFVYINWRTCKKWALDSLTPNLKILRNPCCCNYERKEFFAHYFAKIAFQKYALGTSNKSTLSY